MEAPQYTREQLQQGVQAAIADGNNKAANEIAALYTELYGDPTQAAPEAPQETPQAQTSTPESDGLMDMLFGNMAPNLREAVNQGGADPSTWPGAVAAGAVEGGEMLAANMDVPGGIAGASAGAKLGAPAGPWGLAAGTVIGGAVGTFGGSLLSDYFMGDEVDFSEATKEAAISAGLDVATLGAAKAAKPVMKAMGFTGEQMPDVFNRIFGFTTDAQKADPMAEFGTGLTMGSRDSLQATQELLQESGGSLTAFQTGQASGLRTLAEGLGEIGVLSKGRYEDLARTNANIFGKKVEELVNESLTSVPVEDVGRLVLGTIQGGREALTRKYGDDLALISQNVGKRTVNAKWLKGVIEKFRREGSREGIELYDKGTYKLLNEWEKQLDQLPESTLQLDTLLEFQKKVNRDVSALGDFGATQNTVASLELAVLSDRMRDTSYALVASVDKEAAAALKAANEAYRQGNDVLLPKLNTNIISAADKGNYAVMAQALQGSNPDRIKAFMSSIDEAYARARLAGIDMSERTQLSTPDEVKEVIRRAFLKNTFGEAGGEGFNPENYRRLALQYEKPSNAQVARAILGERNFASFKRLLNGMAESTKRNDGVIGSLVLRSKEADAAQLVGSSLLGAGTGFGMLTAGAILGTPIVLARIASNPKAIPVLIRADKAAAKAAARGGAGVNAAGRILEEALGEIMGMFSEQEQAELRDELRGFEQ